MDFVTLVFYGSIWMKCRFEIFRKTLKYQNEYLQLNNASTYFIIQILRQWESRFLNKHKYSFIILDDQILFYKDPFGCF